MKIKNLFAAAVSSLSAIMAVSCNPENTSVPEQFTVSPLTMTVSPEGDTQKFTVKSNYKWTASCDSWMTLSTYSETASDATVTVAVTVGKNSEEQTRTGKIVITLSTGTSETISVSQEPFVAPKGIYNATDISDIAAALAADEPDLSKWAEDGKISVYNDVDATALTCFPILILPADIEIDGQGHSVTLAISSSEVKVGMFKMLRGTVRNLNLLGTVTVSGELPAETHIGALAADANGAVLENVHNYCSVNVVNVTNAAKVCVIPGGLVGKASNGFTMKDCSNNSDHSFVSAAAGAYHMIGGLVGAYGGTSDEGVCTITGCRNIGNITCDCANTGDWNYVGGIISNVQNSVLIDPDKYVYILDDCEASGDITLTGAAKTRAGGVTGRVNASNKISGCSYSGTISLNAAALERNVGGIGSFQEKTCAGLISDCVFSGKIISERGHTGKYFTGGIISSGCAASTVIENCKTTKDSYISNYNNLGNIGMIISQGGNALTVRNCRIAGTLVTADEEVVLSASNYKSEYVGGTGTSSKTVVDSSCGYNAE